MPEIRRPQRVLLIIIASSFLGLGVVLGLVYLRLWTKASEDLTRLLPATTRAWASSPPPWVGVTQSLTLDRWKDPAAIEDGLLRTGYFATGRTGEIAGLPVDLAREILRGMDAFEIAIVPTASGVSAMVFVELRDVALRKRVVARLQPLVEAVSRHVGFRIDAIHQSPWQRFTGIDPEPPRVVVMDPWIVFAWGEPQGLEDVLDARVGGRRDAIRRREGFLERGDRREVRAVIDAASLWLLVHASVDPDVAAPPVPDGGLVEFLGLLTLVGKVDRGDDVAELFVEIADRELGARMRQALEPGPHELFGVLPAETSMALSVTSTDFGRLAATLSELAERVTRDFAPELLVESHAGPLAESSPTELAARLADVLGSLGRPGGEVAMALLPASVGADAAPPSWVMLVRPASGDTATLESVLASIVPERFGDDYAHGFALIDDVRTYAELPVGEAASAAGAARSGIVWRVRGGLLEVAPDRLTLDRLSLAQVSQRTLEQSGRLARAHRALPKESVAELIIDPSLMADPELPLLQLVAQRLTPDFLTALTLEVDGDTLRLQSNFGFWTLATAIASASRDEIESFALPGLDPACRTAHFAMCRLFPDAVPCRPFSIGRRARILAACEALRRGGNIEPQ